MLMTTQNLSHLKRSCTVTSLEYGNPCGAGSVLNRKHGQQGPGRILTLHTEMEEQQRLYRTLPICFTLQAHSVNAPK